MRYNEFKQTKTSKVVESLYKQLNEVNMSSSALQSFLNSDLGKQVIAGFEAELDFPSMDFRGDNEPDYDTQEYDLDEPVDIGVAMFMGKDISRIIKDLVYDHNYEMSDSEYAIVFDSYTEFFDDFCQNYVENEPEGNDFLRNFIDDFLLLEDFNEQNDVLDEIIVYFEKYAESGYIDHDDFVYNVGDVGESYAIDTIVSFYKQYTKELIDGIGDNVYNDHNLENLRYDLSESIADKIESGDIPISVSTFLRLYNLTLEAPSNYSNYDDEDLNEYYYGDLIKKFISETDGFGYEAEQDRNGDYTVWNFTNDMSLYDRTGVEIVSPAMPLAELLEVMPKFFAWVADNRGTAIEKTGIHMSVSLPNYSYENLDFMKMVLFLGDRYVLDQFGRYGNDMTHLAFDYHTGNTHRSKVNKFGKDPVGTAKAILSSSTFDSLKDKLTNASRAIIEKSNDYQKFVTIHPKKEYVEIRSAGNVDYFKDIEKLKNTIIRYAYALSIAIDPEAEKKEYAKKLYLALSAYSYDSAEGLDKAKIFALYSAGLIDNHNLKQHINKINAKSDIDSNNSNAGYIVKLNSPFTKDAIDEMLNGSTSFSSNSFFYQSFEFIKGDRVQNHYQSLLPNIRNYIMDVMKEFYGSFNDFPKIKTASGKIETFDPRNKEHLPDNQIVITKVKN